MIFNIVITVILCITLVLLMYNVIVGVRTKDDILTVLCGIGSGLVGMLFGLALSSILFKL